MSLSKEILALFGKDVTHDADGINARMHFFGSVPDESIYQQPLNAPELRPKIVALVSINGGVGRSTLVTALSSGLQRLGESVVAPSAISISSSRKASSAGSSRSPVGWRSVLDAWGSASGTR